MQNGVAGGYFCRYFGKCQVNQVYIVGTITEPLDSMIDINSTKKKQLGFRAVIEDHDKKSVMVCLGDESCHAASEGYVKNADWLLSEAFCLRSEKEIFHPYEKSHSIAYDAGLLDICT